MAGRVKTVAILSDVPRIYTCICKQLPAVRLIEVTAGSPDTLQILKEAEVILADFDKIAHYLYQLKDANTKWIQGTWAGIEPIMKRYEEVKEPPPFPVARFSGEHFGTLMSEYVVAQVTAFERDFRTSWEAQKEKKWDVSGKVKNYKAFRDMEVGILGGGQISMRTTLKLLGARIWCLVRSARTAECTEVDEYRTVNGLDELLETCDLIVNVLPHSKSTAGLLNAVNVQKCKGTLFVNIGRGSIIAEADLVEALNKQYFRGAILDVFSEEPLPQSSQLWNFPQVVISPHVAGLTRAEDVAEFFKENLELWESDGMLLNVVDFQKGY